MKAKLEKAVALAELLGALDAHVPPLVAALAEVSDDLTPLFAMLVAAPPQVSDDSTHLFAMPLVAAPLVFGNCYARRTLVCPGETILSQGRYSQRYTPSLSYNEREKIKSQGLQGTKVKADCFGFKRTLDCVDQE